MFLQPNRPVPGIKKIVFTGPECSGKTALTRQLSLSYHAPYSFACPAFSFGKLGPMSFEALRETASFHFYQRNKQTPFNPDNPLLFCDMDAVKFQVYGLEHFDREVPEATKDLRIAPAALYLLCRPDLPVDDPSKYLNPEDREGQFNRFRHYLEKNELPYRIVEGKGDERGFCAAYHIQDLTGYRMNQEWNSRSFITGTRPEHKWIDPQE